MWTDAQIKNLPVPEKRKNIAIDRDRGLYLVHQPTDVKSWAVWYRVNGVQAKFTLGGYPALSLKEARKRALEAKGAAAGGKDLGAAKRAARTERKADGARVRDSAWVFIQRYVRGSGRIGLAWGKEIERLFNIEILPRIGDKLIAEVTKRDINDIVDAITDRGSPVTARNCFAVLRQFFNWARNDRDLIAVSPCVGVTARAEKRSRDRVLEDGELPHAWAAFDAFGFPFGPIGKLLLLTGARRSEIAGARWQEIDLAARTLTLPASRTKNAKPHVIPLSDPAIEIIKALPQIEGKAGFVFSTTGVTPVSGFSKARKAIDKAILDTLRAEALARGADPDGVATPPPWTLHDLRRTVATNLQRLGVRLEVTESVLGHVSGSRGGIVGVYQRHTWADEKRAALAAWARRLDTIVAGANVSNVIDLAKARA
jgi:integrase